MSADQRPAVPRRAVIAAGVGVAACGVVAACDTASPTAAPTAAPAVPPATPAVSDGLQAPRTRTPRPVAATGDIPVGGGEVFPDLRVVVTQPTAGEFRGFGIVCTHDQCELTGVAGGTINCPCHGSRFALTDGAVVRGPARTGLRRERLAVEGDRILLL